MPNLRDYIVFFLIAYLPILFLMPGRPITLKTFILPILPALLFSALLGTLSNLVRAYSKKE